MDIDSFSFSKEEKRERECKRDGKITEIVLKINFVRAIVHAVKNCQVFIREIPRAGIIFRKYFHETAFPFPPVFILGWRKQLLYLRSLVAQFESCENERRFLKIYTYFYILKSMPVENDNYQSGAEPTKNKTDARRLQEKVKPTMFHKMEYYLRYSYPSCNKAKQIVTF